MEGDDLLESSGIAIIRGITGEKGVIVVRAMGKEELTDEELAERTNLKVNIVRSILYKLHDHRLATYRRERDKKTGWYIYYWRLTTDRLKDIILQRKRLVIKNLKERLEYELGSKFFFCPCNGKRYTYEEALEHNFSCPDCSGVMLEIDNSKIIEALKSQIEKLEKELSSEENQ